MLKYSKNEICENRKSNNFHKIFPITQLCRKRNRELQYFVASLLARFKARVRLGIDSNLTIISRLTSLAISICLQNVCLQETNFIKRAYEHLMYELNIF